jgi:flagellar basal-body rod protein FlgB
MFNTIFQRGSIPALEQLLYFTSERHKAIANNIAHVNTLRYKSIDAPEDEFRQAIFAAYQRQKQSPLGVFIFEGTQHVRPKPQGGLAVQFIQSPDPGILTHGENNVDIDKEMAKMLKNARQHNFAATLLRHQFDLMRAAIAERVR